MDGLLQMLRQFGLPGCWADWSVAELRHAIDESRTLTIQDTSRGGPHCSVLEIHR